MSELADAWDRLQTEGLAGDGFIRLRLRIVTACATYAARRLTTGLEALVLEVCTRSLTTTAPYPQSTGFEVSAEPLKPGPSGTARIVLALTHERFRDVFLSLCSDVVQGLASATDETGAVRLFVSRLARWQEFLRKHSLAGLSPDERRGLFGELHFLRRLARALGGHNAVQAWRGWKGANHDFMLFHGSVEVKTTSANTPHSFRVSNAGQLDDSGIEALFLSLIRVDENAPYGESLPDMIDSLRSSIEPGTAAVLDDALISVGYLDAQRDLYKEPVYRIRDQKFFRVHGDFPRIIASSLPAGIEELDYAVAVAACAPFEVSESDVLSQIGQP